MSKKKKRNQPPDEILDDTMDSTFAYIAGYTPGGAPFGTTWEELGIDPRLPMDEKKRLYDEQLVATDGRLTVQDRATIRTIAQELSEIHTTLQDMYLSTDKPELPFNTLMATPERPFASIMALAASAPVTPVLTGTCE